MKVLHVIPSVSLKHGGPSQAIRLIAQSLARAEVQVDVATTDDDGPGGQLDVPLGERVTQDGYGVFYFQKQTDFYKVSWPFRRWIAERIRDYDLVHVHALFSFTSNCAARTAQRQRVPYLIRPLGVLNRWGMRHRRPWLKSLSLKLIERPILRQAAGMHYTSQHEQIHAEAAGATARPFLIPLGIDLSPYNRLPNPEVFFKRCPAARGRRVVLFLGRLDEIKGLEVLLPAFAGVRQSEAEACLIIAGAGQVDYVGKLRRMAGHLGVADAVIWPGFLEGDQKLAAFAAATVFVLPSYSENFGIAAVEALAAGLPCVLSTGVAISADVAAAGAGIVVPPEPMKLKEALVRLLSDDSLNRQCRRNAVRLAEERFSLQAMGQRLLAAYNEVLNGP